MTNYISADLNRLFKRVPRIATLLITFAVFCLASVIYVSVSRLFADPSLAELGLALADSQDVVYNALLQISGYVVGLFGLFELIFVFSDDFKAKTAQIAIGVGVSRVKVIFSKFFELVILLVMDMIVLLGLSILMSGLMGSMLTGAQMLELTGKLATGMLLGNIAYSSLVFILLFSTQSMILAVLGFLALHFNIVSGAISLTGYVKFLQPLHLNSYTLTTQLGRIGSTTGGAAILPFLGVAAYIAVSLGIATLIYRKKELEF